MGRLPAGALGYKNELSESEISGKVVDSVSNLVFRDKKSYLNHTSPVTGYKPTEGEHFGQTYQLIQEAAIKRGKAKAKK